VLFFLVTLTSLAHRSTIPIHCGLSAGLESAQSTAPAGPGRSVRLGYRERSQEGIRHGGSGAAQTRGWVRPGSKPSGCSVATESGVSPSEFRLVSGARPGRSQLKAPSAVLHLPTPPPCGARDPLLPQSRARAAAPSSCADSPCPLPSIPTSALAPSWPPKPNFTIRCEFVLPEPNPNPYWPIPLPFSYLPLPLRSDLRARLGSPPVLIGVRRSGP
jgi:hypothetical protein